MNGLEFCHNVFLNVILRGPQGLESFKGTEEEVEEETETNEENFELVYNDDYNVIDL